MGGGGRVGGVIFMSLLYYMFQSILNTFGFGYFFGGKKLIIFTDVLTLRFSVIISLTPVLYSSVAG